MADNRFLNILETAKSKDIAVGAVNIFNYQTADAAIAAAEKLGVDLIIQTSAGTVTHFGAQKLFDMIDGIRKSVGVEVALHLDHCRDQELGKACVLAGWDGIMMDFSHLSLPENAAATKEMAEYAHKHGAAIEGEIGVISGVEEDIVSEEAVGAGYEETMEFIRLTGIDAVAPAIGTAHGVYKGIPKLDFELVEQLGRAAVPIVIHGGSGLSADTFGRLIRLGGRKINISTVVKLAYLDKIHELVLSGGALNPIPFDTAVKEAVSAVVEKHIAVFSGMKDSF